MRLEALGSQSESIAEQLLKPGEPSADLEVLKQLPVLSDIQTPYTRDDIPRLRKQYAIQVSPVLEGVVEEGRNIPVRDGSTIPIRVHSPSKRPAGGSPLVVNYHGGGFILGDPDPSTDFCRSLVTAFRVVVVNVDYRLAPEHPFPTPINDAWDALQWSALNAASLNCNPELGFIVAGVSARANFAAIVSLLARDHELSPPLTGTFLSALPAIWRDAVPGKYKSSWLSYEQNKNAPILNEPLYGFLIECYQPCPTSHLFAPILHPNGFTHLPRTYFEICGMDPLRDDAIIYERALRVEGGIQTKMDIYPGLPHCFWEIFPGLPASQKFVCDRMARFRWLLDTTE